MVVNMSDSLEWAFLAKKCRLLATEAGDEATLTTLNRLADEYETKAAAYDYLAKVRAQLTPELPANNFDVSR